MNKHEYTVSNMNCDGCVTNIRQALEADERIHNIHIQLSKKLVSLEGSLSSDEARSVISDAGYNPETVSEKKGFLGNLFS